MVLVTLILVFAVISFILALRSMINYREDPQSLSSDLGLFLIGKPQGLTTQTLIQLYQLCLKRRLIISFERLFKQNKTALVLFGDRSTIGELTQHLGLTEIEDYAMDVNKEQLNILYYSLKSHYNSGYIDHVNALIKPELSDNEQFWWQLSLQPLGNKFDRVLFTLYKKFLGGSVNIIGENKDHLFIANIRGILVSNQTKSAVFNSNLNLASIPIPYSTFDKLTICQKRQLSYSAKLSLLITPKNILSLIKLG